jgi:hypothetical protein
VASKFLRASEVFGAGILGATGWVEVSSPTPALQGSLAVLDSKTGFLFGSARLQSSSSRLVFPSISATNPFPTRLSLINTRPEVIQASFSLSMSREAN